MEIAFRFEHLWHDNDLVKLHISVWQGAFGGAANVYVGKGELEDIAAKLRGFPESLADAREVIFGAFGPNYLGGAVRMQCRCIDKSLHAEIVADIESEAERGSIPETVRLRFPVETEAINIFIRELELLGKRLEGTALLRGFGSKNSANRYRDGARNVYAAVGEILLKEWDPIGVGDVPQACDEYDAYIPPLYSMLINGRTTTEIFDYLWRVETGYMGLRGDRLRTETIASRLSSLKRKL